MEIDYDNPAAVEAEFNRLVRNLPTVRHVILAGQRGAGWDVLHMRAVMVVALAHEVETLRNLLLKVMAESPRVVDFEKLNRSLELPNEKEI